MHRTKTVLESITGGESYAVVVPILGSYRPDRPVPIAVENHGPDILTGVTVTVYASGIWIEATHDSILQSLANRINVGTLHAGERLVLAAQLHPASLMNLSDPKSPTSTRAFIYIAAQNFTSVEYLDFKKDNNGEWNYKYELRKQPTKNTKPNAKGWIKPEPILEEVDWSTDANNPVRRRSDPCIPDCRKSTKHE